MALCCLERACFGLWVPDGALHGVLSSLSLLLILEIFFGPKLGQLFTSYPSSPLALGLLYDGFATLHAIEPCNLDNSALLAHESCFGSLCPSCKGGNQETWLFSAIWPREKWHAPPFLFPLLFWTGWHHTFAICAPKLVTSVSTQPREHLGQLCLCTAKHREMYGDVSLF